MTNSQTYCDYCGKRWETFTDKVTIHNHELGVRSYDLCWACGRQWVEFFNDKATAVKETRFEVRTVAEKAAERTRR